MQERGDGLGGLWSRMVLTEAREVLVEVLELVLTRLEDDRPNRGAEPRSGSDEVWLF